LTLINNTNLYDISQITTVGGIFISLYNSIQCRYISNTLKSSASPIECCGNGIISPNNNEICDTKTNCTYDCSNCTGAYGNCLDCLEGFYGSNCDKLCGNCNNGACSDGMNGNGSCSQCNPNYFGSNCDISKDISNGQLIPNDLKT